MKEPSNLAEAWEDGAIVEALWEESEAGPVVTIAANREGLLSLSKLFLYLAKEEQKEYYHVHLDRYSGLESSSNVGLILQKVSFREPPNR